MKTISLLCCSVVASELLNELTGGNMKSIILLMIGLFLSFTSATQPCLQKGITFTTQDEIDNFHQKFPNCDQIDGDVNIVSEDSIVSLKGLSGVKSISGSLCIGGNIGLTCLSGLERLRSIGGTLWIEFNMNLESLKGLDSLNSIGGSLWILNNPLTNLAGLELLTTIGGDVWLANNALTSLEGINNLINIGGNVQLESNYALTSLSGLDNITCIKGNLIIGSNKVLNDLTTLHNVSSIDENLELYDNDALTNLKGFEGLTFIGGDLRIGTYHGDGQFGNRCLASISSLKNVSFVGGCIKIKWNPALMTLTGLDNIDPHPVDGIDIRFNTILSICGVQSICDYLSRPELTIQNNQTGCNCKLDLVAACNALHLRKAFFDNDFSCYPNPASALITIETKGEGVLFIMNPDGKLFLTHTITDTKMMVDISSLPSGYYIILIVGGRLVETAQLVKL